MKQTTVYLRIESGVIFVSSLYLYLFLDFNLLVFGLLLFSFDIFMIGYLFNPKLGAYVYNLGHSLIFPPTLLTVGLATDTRNLIAFSLIWFAHIGLDRGLGYGLKYEKGFTHTHLGTIGKDRSDSK